MVMKNIVVLSLCLVILRVSAQEIGFTPVPVTEKQCGADMCGAGEKCIDVVSEHCEDVTCTRFPTCVPIQDSDCDFMFCPEGEVCLNVRTQCGNTEENCVTKKKCVRNESQGAQDNCGVEPCRTGEVCYELADSGCKDSNCVKYPTCMKLQELPCNNANCPETSQCVNIRTECPYTACDIYARCVPKAEKCVLPSAWHGSWFQDGVNDPILIQKNAISFRGSCVDQDRNKFLFKDLQTNCSRCLLMEEKHRNVIQYKESYCEQHQTLQRLCSQIIEDSVLMMLLRIDNAKPVPCPMHGNFHMEYNNGRGWCLYPASEVHTCISNTSLIFNFMACPDVRASENSVEELQCLATWKEGSTNYLVGKLKHQHYQTHDNKFRCFLYEWLEGGVTYQMTQSEDGTCNGLYSSTDGARAMKLVEENDTQRGCSFPSWLTSKVRLQSSDGKTTWQVMENNSRTSMISEGKVMEKLVCHHIVADSPEAGATIIAHRTQGCESGYVCMEFNKYYNTLQVITGQLSSLPGDAFESCQFNAPYSNTTFNDEDVVFDPRNPVQVTAKEGSSAQLPCTVIDKGNNNPVTWMRTRDQYMITVSDIVLPKNSRFGIMHEPDSSTWTLLINSLQLSDAGTYRCSIRFVNMDIQLDVEETGPMCGRARCLKSQCKNAFKCNERECRNNDFCLPEDAPTCDGVLCKENTSCAMIEPSVCRSPDCHPVPQCLFSSSSVGTSNTETRFSSDTPTNITAQLGSTAYLPCKIFHLGDKSVSWILKRNFYLLAANTFIIASDSRFESHYEESSSTWTFLIRDVKVSDSGLYECRVSTIPIISKIIRLNVVDSTSSVETSAMVPQFSSDMRNEIYIRPGSNVEIPCEVLYLGNKTVSWIREKDSKVLTIGRYSFTSDSRVQSLNDEESSTWILQIRDVQASDAGAYQCQVSTEQKMTKIVTLHVVDSTSSVETSAMVPQFSPDMSNEIYVSSGSNAEIPCEVLHLGNKTVSWIRERDFHILTVGRYTYISDLRVQSLNEEGSSTWTLQIKNVQLSDAGAYQCQVSTEPKITKIVTLHVVVSTSSVETSAMVPQFSPDMSNEVYANAGSNAEIPCEVLHLGNKTVSWIRKRDFHVLTVGRYTYTSDSRVQSLNEEGSSTWILQIRDVQASDVGVYQCQVSTEPKMTKIVALHVVEKYNKEGSCPLPDSAAVGACVEECVSDDDCPGALKCCSNGCGSICARPVHPGDIQSSQAGCDSTLCNADETCVKSLECSSEGCQMGTSCILLPETGASNAQECGEVFCSDDERCEAVHQCQVWNCRSYNACRSSNDGNWMECGHSICDPGAECDMIHECLQSECNNYRKCLRYKSLPPVVEVLLGMSSNANEVEAYFKCITNSSRPVPVNWIHNGQRIENHAGEGILITNDVLMLQRLQSHKPGLYQCSSEDRFSTPISLKIQPVDDSKQCDGVVCNAEEQCERVHACREIGCASYRTCLPNNINKCDDAGCKTCKMVQIKHCFRAPCHPEPECIRGLPKVEISLGRHANPYIEEGDDIYFECWLTSTELPVSKVSWKHNDTLLSQDLRQGIIVSNRSIVLQKISRHHSGAYQCLAEHAEGVGYSHLISIKVLHPPEVKIRLGSLIDAESINVGDDIYFECVTSSDPPPARFEWFFEDDLLEQDRSRGIIVSNSSLVIQLVQKENAGRYRCSAENRLGRGVSPDAVNVHVQE